MPEAIGRARAGRQISEGRIERWVARDPAANVADHRPMRARKNWILRRARLN
jgi:hypothetical protein